MSIEDSSFEPVPGLRCGEVKLCSGPVVTTGSSVTLLYKVALSEEALDSGDCVESNFAPDLPIEVVATKEDLLPGVYWTLVGMRAGGSVRRARVSADLAFGQRGSGTGSVPPGSEIWIELCVSQVSDTFSGGARGTEPGLN
ncbi:MAG: FKBP-type peptidyl-prolyl cis-trans isomerase [Acidimicrobiales bacterium]|nr:FKBP-type peptidyl-prolyl cis-trans isomerase [Acidimicrobiales bacterium]